MKLRHLLGIASIFMLILAIQSCSTDYTLSDEDEALKTRIVKAAVIKGEYCRYNVTESSVPNMKNGSIVCYPCTNSCVDPISSKPYTKIITDATGKKDTITQGYVSGDLGHNASSCDNCPSSGQKSAT